MTEIRMDWGTLRITADGHAGGGEKGQDIICAGISALMMALLNQLLEEKQNRTKWEKNDGHIEIQPHPPDIMRPRIIHYYQVIMMGLRAWQQTFPENIRIEEE